MAEPTGEPTYVAPQNLDAEESVLGAMMLSPVAIEAVGEVVMASDFYRETHGTIYKAALSLYEKGQPVDAITLVDELERRNELETIGGRRRIHELAALVPATGNAGHYARIVREMAVLRALLRAAAEVQLHVYERRADAPDLVERAQEVFFGLSDDRTRRADMTRAGDALAPTLARVQELQESGRDIVGLSTGLERLDALTSGLHPGNLIILAARPSMGKTALGITIGAHVAVHLGVPVGMFTLEMSIDEVMQRLLALEAFVDSTRNPNAKIDAGSWAKLHHAAAKIDQAPLWLEDSGSLTMMELRAKARRLKTRHPDLGLIVVDYLQLMAPEPTASDRGRVQEVSQISRALKVLARELNVPVLALSQLSRAVEQRHDKRPILSDLRESGSLEQDADLVWLLYRDEYYHPEDPDVEGLAELNIAKQRNGPTDVLKLAWAKRFARFSTLAPEH